MSFWSRAKIILIPPNKGDIRVRCKISTISSLENENENENENDGSSNISNKNQTESKNENLQETILVAEQNSAAPARNGNKFIDFLTLIPRKTTCLFKKGKETIEKVQKLREYETNNDYTSPLDTFIGFAVEVTGSGYMMLLVVLILIAWIVWGIVAGAPDNWQIVMQDGQSIQTYVWDTFLMRQQLDDNEKFLILYGRLTSRIETHKRIILKLKEEHPDVDAKSKMEQIQDLKNHEFRKVQFKPKSFFDKISDIVSKILGNLYAVIIYWIGIFVWVGCGALYNNNGTDENPLWQKFSNNWQMYINTTTAIILLFTSVFLEHVRSKSNDYIMSQIDLFNSLDRDLECLERQLAGDLQDNELIVVKRCPRDAIQKRISFFADVIGNGLGLIISTLVFIAWFSIGNVMHWSDNWWLVIGTYTGLVGFIDGFVLREVYFSLTNYEQQQFDGLFNDSQELIEICEIPQVLKKYQPVITFDVKVSLWINKLCSNKWSVIFACFTVLGLVVMACGLLWSETAQLVCNTPTMIIEGFFLLILIQAHNWADEDRCGMIGELTRSRMLLYNYVDSCFGEKIEHTHDYHSLDEEDERMSREMFLDEINV